MYWGNAIPAAVVCGVVLALQWRLFVASRRHIARRCELWAGACNAQAFIQTPIAAAERELLRGIESVAQIIWLRRLGAVAPLAGVLLTTLGLVGASTLHSTLDSDPMGPDQLAPLLPALLAGVSVGATLAIVNHLFLARLESIELRTVDELLRSVSLHCFAESPRELREVVALVHGSGKELAQTIVGLRGASELLADFASAVAADGSAAASQLQGSADALVNALAGPTKQLGEATRSMEMGFATMLAALRRVTDATEASVSHQLDQTSKAIDALATNGEQTQRILQSLKDSTVPDIGAAVTRLQTHCDLLKSAMSGASAAATNWAAESGALMERSRTALSGFAADLSQLGEATEHVRSVMRTSADLEVKAIEECSSQLARLATSASESKLALEGVAGSTAEMGRLAEQVEKLRRVLLFFSRQLHAEGQRFRQPVTTVGPVHLTQVDGQAVP